ncbi:hypothetical protein CCR75_004744 [Bremia lactucae]|uniref:Fascin-like domain-containing protein n=1 Tax=Bremia lactucae TaxID=4779 RepID=A0A976FL49_BRELC|nr:hypothetical protein CCR75_004744 [Bremia lactucae]
MTSKAPLVLSLATSGAFLFAASKISETVAHTPFITIAFIALIPTLVSIDIVTDGRGCFILAYLWKTIAVTNRSNQGLKVAAIENLAAARIELIRTFGERWPQHTRASLKRPLGLSSHGYDVLPLATSGGSLYDQVRGRLTDHAISYSKDDAPVYLMDSETGYFLRATQHRKIVLTSKPNASCLFHVERGKTHHWGFRAAATQRYMGQNIVQKLVATSKKLHAWEAFRILQRPGEKEVGGCSPQVYLILCSARFGKGMWLANKPGLTIAAPAGNSAKDILGNDQILVSQQNHTFQQRKCDIFLSKQIDYAIGLMYSSDLSALLAAAGSQNRNLSRLRALERAHTAPHSSVDMRQRDSTSQPTSMQGNDKLQQLSSQGNCTMQQASRQNYGDCFLKNCEPRLNSSIERTSSFFEKRKDDTPELMKSTVPSSSKTESSV